MCSSPVSYIHRNRAPYTSLVVQGLCVCSKISILLSFIAFAPHVQAVSILSYIGRMGRAVMEERQRVVLLEGFGSC